MSQDPYSPEAMRKELNDVIKKIDDIEAKSKPLREKRDAWVAEVQRREQEWNQTLLKVEHGLAALKRKYAILTKACGPGKVMRAEGAVLGSEGKDTLE